MGKIAAVLYVPMMKGKVVSWHQRLKGRSVMDLNKVLSSFYDELDPLSETQPPQALAQCHCSLPAEC